jgi:hypothetical protein
LLLGLQRRGDIRRRRLRWQVAHGKITGGTAAQRQRQK